jgi:hypothetical protein
MSSKGSFWSVTVALAALVTSTARAETIYNYTGTVFQYGTMLYVNTKHISGSVTLSQPLGSSVTESVTPIAFSFTDGKQTISDKSSLDPNRKLFKFTTDATGNVTNWAVDVEILQQGRSPNDNISTCGTVDREYAYFCTANDIANTIPTNGYNSTPGKWSKEK